MSKIQESINKLMQQHRLLLWYDAEQKFTEEYEALTLAEGEKITVQNNQLAVKYKVLLQHPQQKYLIYLPHPRPEDSDNWLLDLELSFHVYHTDQQALYLQELGLGYHLKEWITEHLEFFNSKQRLARFAQLLEPDETETILTVKLMQVVFGSEYSTLEAFLSQYATAFVQERHHTIEKELERFGLKEPFWRAVGQRFGYYNETPGIYDFSIGAFGKTFSLTANQSALNRETTVLLSTWKDTRSFEQTFNTLSHRIQKDLGIESKLQLAVIEEILNDDVFELVDRRIVSDIVTLVINNSIDYKRLDTILKRRQSKYWYSQYQAFYKAIEEAFLLVQFIRKHEKLRIPDFETGLEQYASSWYEADQRYRKFIEYYRETGQNNVLNNLYQHINKAYNNSWLLNLGNCWQEVMDKQTDFPYSAPFSQRRFFARAVKPLIEEKKKLFVIISDAFRYECGAELHALFQKENRFASTLSYQFATLPSYTQLGMAALLPHTQLTLVTDTDDVLLDGQPTKGLEARKKILQAGSGVRATAIAAEEVMKLATKSPEAKEFMKQHDLFYIYHNRIDKVGDDKTQEEKVIDAAKNEVLFLLDLVKKIKNLNGTRIIITADHGFLYQNEPLAESDFADADITGKLHKYNRRFVIGKDLVYKKGMKAYKGYQLGIESDVDVLIPKSINRLRVQGAGSRFIHGGASLQELIIPVLDVIAKRENTVEKVEVDLLNKANNRISTNLQGVQFYQTKPVGSQLIGRSLKASFKAEDGEVISDVFNFTFDSESENAADREKYHGFQISSKASTQYKNETVYLVLEEQIEGTSAWVEYQKYAYNVNISFTSDFDDF
ncbi:MAG TPA: BREX-1 system phosphatase PglZ type A [Flavisolibacter sp.]|jgi:uncharacterized protein (TIGR02687 family)|nr:BREX-1 system phosphatase PglZ type A [Flavisolibacter sp.]